MDEPVDIDALKVHVRQHRHELAPGCAQRPARAASRSTHSRGSRKATCPTWRTSGGSSNPA